MVPKVLTNTRLITNNGNPKLLKLLLWADTREHEQVGRFESPGAQHNCVCCNVETLTSALSFYADNL